MEGSSSRASVPGDRGINGEASSSDWRSKFPPGGHHRVVNKIMDTLRRHLPMSTPEGLGELKKIAVRFEEKIYSSATNQTDYLRKISMKMLAMEQKTQGSVAANPLSSNPTITGQNSVDPSSVNVSLHSQASSITKFNGLNYNEWSEEVKFHLGVLDIDLTLMTDTPVALTETSNNEEKSSNKSCERSNRLSLMLMRMIVANNIKTTIPETNDAKEFMKFVKDTVQSESAEKSRAGTLMSMLTTMKFDGSHTMHQHVTEMSNLAARLRTMGMKVDDSFLVKFIINSLPQEYGLFQINYNTMKDKWNVTELQSMLIQEEARLKRQRIHSINLVGHSGVKRKPGKTYGKDNKGLLKIHESSAKIHKKEQNGGKCHFCHKPGHYQKDCHKRKAWFESKGIRYDPNHKPK